MCAAYVEQLAGDRYEPLAAALEPAVGLGRETAAALSEDGLPAADGPGRKMTADLADIVDRIITLGFTLNPEVARDVPREEWGIPDPAGRVFRFGSANEPATAECDTATIGGTQAGNSRGK